MFRVFFTLSCALLSRSPCIHAQDALPVTVAAGGPYTLYFGNSSGHNVPPMFDVDGGLTVPALEDATRDFLQDFLGRQEGQGTDPGTLITVGALRAALQNADCIFHDRLSSGHFKLFQGRHGLADVDVLDTNPNRVADAVHIADDPRAIYVVAVPDEVEMDRFDDFAHRLSGEMMMAPASSADAHAGPRAPDMPGGARAVGPADVEAPAQQGPPRPSSEGAGVLAANMAGRGAARTLPLLAGGPAAPAGDGLRPGATGCYAKLEERRAALVLRHGSPCGGRWTLQRDLVQFRRVVLGIPDHWASEHGLLARRGQEMMIAGTPPPVLQLVNEGIECAALRQTRYCGRPVPAEGTRPLARIDQEFHNMDLLSTRRLRAVAAWMPLMCLLSGVVVWTPLMYLVSLLSSDLGARLCNLVLSAGTGFFGFQEACGYIQETISTHGRASLIEPAGAASRIRTVGARGSACLFGALAVVFQIFFFLCRIPADPVHLAGVPAVATGIAVASTCWPWQGFQFPYLFEDENRRIERLRGIRVDVVNDLAQDVVRAVALGRMLQRNGV